MIARLRQLGGLRALSCGLVACFVLALAGQRDARANGADSVRAPTQTASPIAIPVAAGETAGVAPPETAQPCAAASDAGRPRILATITGVHSSAGNVTLTLYGNAPDRFLKHKGSIALQRVPIENGTARGCFVLSRPGTYAVAVYHDENNNHRFDRSLIGLPVEGYGFSRNAPIFMAPPSFGSVRIEAGSGDTSLSIALRY